MTQPPSPTRPGPLARAARVGGRAARRLVAMLPLVGLLACAQMPARPPSPTPGAPADVAVHDHRGRLPPAAEARTLQQVKTEGRAEAVEHHLRVLSASGDVDLYRHNATRLLIDGPATFAAMKQAVAQARQRILLESYIIEDSKMADDLARLLAAKAGAGVAVAVMYDAVGSLQTDAAYFERLAASGVRVCKFNPIHPLERPRYWAINHRNHRKLLVVDNDIALTGGINISRVYASGSSARLSGRRRAADTDPRTDGWRDTHIELRGPVVPAMADGFVRLWQSQGCAGSTGSAGPPRQAAPGQRVVKLLESDPTQESNRIYAALLGAIEASRRSIHLTMAYFAPGREVVDALCDAARRGVEVSLLLPGRSDFELILHAGRSYYAQLLEAGVRIHEMDDAVMHAKTAVIDGVFSTVGSSNMDWRSFVANNEINVIVLGEDFGAELEALFARDLGTARPITEAAWRGRGLWPRVLETVGRMAERVL
jgi:cardiolipin synthase